MGGRIVFYAYFEEVLDRGPQLPGHTARQWGGKQASEASPYLQPLPIACITAWAPAPVRSTEPLDSHRSLNATVNCACKGSGLRAPYMRIILKPSLPGFVE